MYRAAQHCRAWTRSRYADCHMTSNRSEFPTGPVPGFARGGGPSRVVSGTSRLEKDLGIRWQVRKLYPDPCHSQFEWPDL